MIIVSNAKNSHVVKDPVLLSYRGGKKKKKKAYLLRKKSHQGL